MSIFTSSTASLRTTGPSFVEGSFEAENPMRRRTELAAKRSFAPTHTVAKSRTALAVLRIAKKTSGTQKSVATRAESAAAGAFRKPMSSPHSLSTMHTETMSSIRESRSGTPSSIGSIFEDEEVIQLDSSSDLDRELGIHEECELSSDTMAELDKVLSDETTRETTTGPHARSRVRRLAEEAPSSEFEVELMDSILNEMKKGAWQSLRKDVKSRDWMRAARHRAGVIYDLMQGRHPLQKIEPQLKEAEVTLNHYIAELEAADVKDEERINALKDKAEGLQNLLERVQEVTTLTTREKVEVVCAVVGILLAVVPFAL